MEENNKFETEIDFKELPKSPSRLFGWIFPFYLILFLIVGIYFVKHMNNASFNSVPAIYTDSLGVDVDVPVKKGGIMPAIDLAIISNPTPAIIDKGKELFNTTCASCHGNDGMGDGVAAAALNPPPRNFHEVEGWKNGREITGMFKTLQEGIPGTGMVAYEYIPVEDRIALIQYIRTFGDFPEITDELVAELDRTYELSKGVVTPNTISLEMARKKILEENSSEKNQIEKINFDELKDKKPEQFNLLINYSVDPKTALEIFDNNPVNDIDNFIKRITLFPKENGFKTNITSLSKKDLNKLYDLLSNLKG